MACGGVFFTCYVLPPWCWGAGRPFTWGISEALGVTLGGVPLYVPVLVPVLYLAAYVHLSIVFGFGLHEHARPLQWYSVMLTYTIYMYT